MLSYKKFTKDVGLITLVNFLVIIKGIIFLPLITKILGTFSYGIWAQLLVTVSLLSPLIKLGLPNAIVRYLAAEKNKEKAKEGIYSTLVLITIISFFVYLVFLIFIHPLSQFFQCPPLLIILLPSIILFECFNTVLLTTFQALQEMVKYSVFVIIASLGEMIFVAFSILGGYGLAGAVISLLVVKIAVFLLLFLNIYTAIGFKIPQFNLVKQYLSFGFPTLISNLSYLLVTSADKYLVGFFLGTLFVGYYAPAYSLGNLITFFIIPISFVLFPAVSKSYDEQKMNEVKNKLKYSLKYFLLIAIPAVFGVSVLIKDLLQIFTTQDISSHAFFVTPLIALSILFYGASDIFSEILTLVHKTKIVGFIWLGAAVVNITVDLFLIPKFGILGAAIATLVAYLFAFFFIWYYSFKEFIFEIDWLGIIKILFCSLLMAFLVSAINPKNLFMTIVAVVTGIISYSLLVIITRIITKKEYTFLKELLKKPVIPSPSSNSANFP